MQKTVLLIGMLGSMDIPLLKTSPREQKWSLWIWDKTHFSLDLTTGSPSSMASLTDDVSVTSGFKLQYANTSAV